MIKKNLDLHFHSYYSGGAFSPEAVIRLTRQFNIGVMALSDHNTIAGTKEFLTAAKKAKIIGLPAVEIYTTWRTKNLHILGYLFNTENDWLRTSLDKLCSERQRNIERSLYFLQKAGFIIDIKNVWQTKSRYISLAHLIGCLEKNPKNKAKIKKDLKTDEPNFFDVINYYFNRPCKTRLEQTSLPAKKAIAIIKQAGGLAVLAHPGQQLSWSDDYIIRELKEIGIIGIEVFSPYHSWHQIEHYQFLAKKLNLKITGGTDFHSPLLLKSKKYISLPWQYYHIPTSLYYNLIK